MIDELDGQFVLAVPRERLVSAGLCAGFVPPERAADVLEEVLVSGDFVPRHRAEHDSSLVQPIPAALIHANAKVLVLERRERNKRSHLHRRLVLWAGGHVQIEDAVPVPQDLLMSALGRELAEELDLAVGKPDLRGIVSDGKSLHFAVVYDVPASAPLGAVANTNEEFRLSRGKSPSGYFLDLDSLDKRYNQLESWSKMILADILLRRVRLPQGAKSESQLKFDMVTLNPAFLGREN
ncbi:MAG: hypothetical protein WEE64_00215 [Dehalococcoidia bacterium]